MKIVLSTIATLLLLGCSESTQENAQKQMTEVVQKSKEVAQETKKLAEESAVEVQEKSEEIVEDVSEEVKTITKKAQTKSSEVVKKVESNVDASREKLAEAIEPKKETSIDGAAIYKACISCHGANAEKKALNKSQIIQGWEVSKTAAALQGYKDGSYGGPMKGIMKPQVAKLSDAEINAVAKYILGL